MPFSTDPGRCFAWVTDPGRHGQPMRCPASAPRRGVYVAPRGVYEVDACQEHMAELDRPTRAGEPRRTSGPRA